MLRMLLIVGGAFAIAASVPQSAAAAPSFNCKRAASIAEKEICGLPDLEALDREIAASFKQAVTVLNPADVQALRASQRGWLKERDDCGDLIHGDPPIYAGVFACLREQMTARTKKLREIVSQRKFVK